MALGQTHLTLPARRQHRHISKERIDLALEQLLKLGLINRETTACRGRSATLWTKAQKPGTGTNIPETDPYGA